MKAFFLSLPVIGIAAGAYAQGFVFLDNIHNTNYSPTATSSGLFFIAPCCNMVVLMNGDFNAAFYGGTDSANLQLIASFWGPTAGTGGFGPGTFLDPTGKSYPVPGTTDSSTSAFFMIQAWTGTATSYYMAGGPKGFSPVFSNPVGPLPNPPDFVNMPAFCMGCIPEPTTFALIAFGAVGLCGFRLLWHNKSVQS